MTTLQSLFDIYKIKKALIKVDDVVEIIILKREEQWTLDKWLNLITTLKRIYHKDVTFILEDDAKRIYGGLSVFELIGGDNDG